MPGAPLLQRIRHATADLHTRVERLPLMARLLAPDLSASEYRRVLERMWGFYAPLEARLVPPQAPGYAFQPRTPRLAADLRHLGASTAGLPRCTALPDLSGESRVWGCLYVLEGAALGGRVILTHLARSQGVSREKGAAFFGGSPSTGADWKAFLAHLEGAVLPPDHPAVAEAAEETFDALYQWLQA